MMNFNGFLNEPTAAFTFREEPKTKREKIWQDFEDKIYLIVMRAELKAMRYSLEYLKPKPSFDLVVGNCNFGDLEGSFSGVEFRSSPHLEEGKAYLINTSAAFNMRQPPIRFEGI